MSHFNKTYFSPRVLIAPLDWGLGHATRCIPLINELITHNCKVIIAADGPVKILLQKEFPALDFVTLPGYKISYNRSKGLMPLKILLQVPSILLTIYNEHRWLQQIIQQYSIDAVISDNRFGLFSSKVPSVYITHQLKIKTGNHFIESIIQKINYWFIKKYTECWVPDFDAGKHIAGELSHPEVLPGNEKYIGCLSRFERSDYSDKKFDLVAIVSGPEPQRTIFENKLLLQLKEFSGKTLLVRGLPDNSASIQTEIEGVKIVNHLDANELGKNIQQAEWVIGRTGYTTVMDLIKIRQKAILVPTPGQTEQEYLALYLMNRKIFYCIDQDQFVLKDAIEKASAISYRVVDENMELYKKNIDNFIKLLQQD